MYVLQHLSDWGAYNDPIIPQFLYNEDNLNNKTERKIIFESQAQSDFLLNLINIHLMWENFSKTFQKKPNLATMINQP